MVLPGLRVSPLPMIRVALRAPPAPVADGVAVGEAPVFLGLTLVGRAGDVPAGLCAGGLLA